MVALTGFIMTVRHHHFTKLVTFVKCYALFYHSCTSMSR